MRQMLGFSFSYLKYYKKQTIALLAGLVLSTAILTGMGSLMESGRVAAMEHERSQYGDWHYAVRCDYPQFSDFESRRKGDGYEVQRSGVLTIRKILEKPYEITMAYGDSDYMEMMGRKFLKGHYPLEDNEIALDSFTLKNLNVPEAVGSKVTLNGQKFVVSGIVSGSPHPDLMQVFVSKDLDYGTNGKFLYLKFTEGKRVYKQAEAFIQTFDVALKTVNKNHQLLDYVGGGSAKDLYDVIKTGLTVEGTGLPFIWGSLNEQLNLTEKAVIAALGLFSAFIIYSLFQVSVIKRRSQYSVMQTVGMGRKYTFGVLAGELSMVFLAGYPIGCLLGNVGASLVYKAIGQIFVLPDEGRTHAQAEQAVGVWDLPDPGAFHISFDVIVGGVVFLLLLIFFISFMLVRSMDKLTLHQLMVKDSGNKRRRRKIYSRKHSNLSEILTRKFMFQRKGAFVGILLSLSIGGIIFLGAVFVTQNTEKNNELSFKADDGLGSDIQVFESSDQLSDRIPESSLVQIQKVSGLSQVNPVRYMLGEILLLNGTFKWTSFYPEIAGRAGVVQNQAIMEKYNGIAVKAGEDDYRIKVNIYGYSDQMIRELNDYLLEGKIDPASMRRNNSVIFKTLMDGQGNYDGIDISQGDLVSLKTPINSEAAGKVLRFQSEDSRYRQQNLKVAALVSRPLAKVENYIGDDGESVDIIMTNEQMKQNFGVTGYQTISITLEDGKKGAKAADQIKKAVLGIDQCVVKDYTSQIQMQNLFLSQKMMFFYGVALILLVISLLHIMNSMQYLVAARKHEFGILRAMGITNGGFRKMLVKEGIRYGVYSGIATLLLYTGVQKLLYYFMVHVYLYLQPRDAISPLPVVLILIINLIICTGAVLLSGETVLKQQIVDEIRE